MRIRAAAVAELTILQEIEIAAGRCFADIGMAAIASDEPFAVEELGRYRAAGRAWVATDDVNHPVAYLLADEVDGNLHIEQVSVHPDSAGHGIGRRLIEHAAAVAMAGGCPALTLTTFTDVTWNAPYYERCGFRRLRDDELTPGLVAIRRAEAAHGLDRWTRLCMRRDLGEVSM